jgi:hypothetical protein
MFTNFPKQFEDIEILYEDKWYWGYYSGGNTWRIGVSEDGRLDDYVTTNEIQNWCYPVEKYKKLE